MRILIVTQRLDAEHDVLGFFAGWVEALAAAADRVEVVAQWVGEHPFAAATPVHSLGKEGGAGKLRQLARLERVLWRRLIRRRAVDLVFCHMCPEYVPLCYPLARLGNANDMVGTAIFLASNASAFMTGQTLRVDGGTSAGYAWPIDQM